MILIYLKDMKIAANLWFVYFYMNVFSDANADTDVDFDPTADMLVHDCDDERTLDEEEAMSNEESVANELDDLQKVRIFNFLALWKLMSDVWVSCVIVAV